MISSKLPSLWTVCLDRYDAKLVSVLLWRQLAACMLATVRSVKSRAAEGIKATARNRTTRSSPIFYYLPPLLVFNFFLKQVEAHYRYATSHFFTLKLDSSILVGVSF